MTDLHQTYAFLNQALQADSVLCLAQAVAWLDPLWRDDEADFDMEADGILGAALVVTRRVFPELYVDAVQQIRAGASYADLDSLICEGISATGIPLETLEHLPYGIPLPAYGAMLDDADFYAHHPDVVPVLACFGITPFPNPYHVDVPQCAYTAADLLAGDLAHQPDERYQQVAWALRWLFSCSHNSICDWDQEMMWEVQPLLWDTEDMAFARLMIEEADEIMGEALAGLAWLTEQPAILQSLQDNIRRIYKAIQKKGKADDVPNIRLKWVSLSE